MRDKRLVRRRDALPAVTGGLPIEPDVVPSGANALEYVVLPLSGTRPNCDDGGRVESLS